MVFASQESGFIVLNERHQGAALGFLLYLLPGIVGGLLSRGSKITCPLLGALLVSPLCLLLFNVSNQLHYSLWYQVTYLLSAIFWCACGALVCFFASEIFKRHTLL
ncbi:hypothetical protein GTU79_08255 [Sodalis ligni]|nr:hypothetical protein GTU79_08255 [Sodalis ligni]